MMNNTSEPKFKNFLMAIPSYVIGFFKNNTALKIAALVFAVLIWVFVITDTNPTRKVTIDNIPISIIGNGELAAKDLIIVSGLDGVSACSVTVSAVQNDIKYISDQNVRVSLNLATVSTTGTVDVKLGATSPGTSTIVEVSPAFVRLEVDELVSKEVPIAYKYIGNMPTDIYIKEPVFTPATVNIRGSKKVLSRIVVAVCNIDVASAMASKNESRELVLQDANGETIPLAGISGGAPTAILNLEVLRKKTVGFDMAQVKNSIAGVASGYYIKNITLNPPSYEVAGSDEALSQFLNMPLSRIELENAKKPLTVTGSFTEINGIFLMNPVFPELFIEIEEISKDFTFEDVAVSMYGADGEYSYSYSTLTADITITVPQSVAELLKRDDIELYFDVSDANPGTFDLPITLKPIAGLGQVAFRITPSSVTVVITAK